MFNLNFLIKKSNQIILNLDFHFTIIDLNYFALKNEKLYSVKISPNYVSLSVIRDNDSEKVIEQHSFNNKQKILN